MNKHLFRLLFGALFLVAATVFTGCKEDDSKSATPTLSVSTESLVFTDATEKTQTVQITANCEWKVVTSSLEWATVEPMNGRGNGTISVTVQELPAGTNLREGKISFTLIHAEFGNWGTAEQSIAVSQVAGSEVPTGEIAYANNFDKEAATQTYGSGNSWPYTDQFDGWKNESGYGIADVTYTTSGISVRNNSNSNNNYSDYAGSGVNNLLFSSNSNFTIEKIAVNSVNLRLTFGTERYAYGEDDNTFNHDEFKVQLSNDGTNWSAPLTYTFAMGVDPNGRWDLASSDFSLPDGTTTLYIRFQATVASAYRLDDATLLEGAGGQAITFDYTEEPDEPVGPNPENAIYFNNFDKEIATNSNGWPLANAFDGWKNETGSGVANVTYDASSGVSVRTTSDSASNYSDYEGSGNNNMFFGTDGVLTIGNIAVSEKNLSLSFGAERYIQGGDNTFDHDEFKVQLSNNGTDWSAPVTYTFAKGVDPNGRWDFATADFTLPDGVTALYVRFTSTIASGHRLDDMLLQAGNGGQQVSFDGSEEPDPEPGDAVETTIPELIALCEAAGSEQQVIDESKDYYFEAVVVTDKEGGNTTSNNLQLMTEGATTAKNGITLYGSGVYTNPADEGFTFKAGDKVKVTLKAGEARVTTYNKLYEVTGSQGASWVVVEKIGTATVTPVEIAPNQITDFQAMPVSIKNVTAPATASTWNGTKTFTQNGVEVTVYTSQGAPWADQQFVAGATGTITGYAALYKGAAQVSPRNTKDIADFMSGTTPEPDPDVTPIGEITTAGTYKTEGTVVARGKMAYIIADNTGAMMVDHKDNERSVGEKISISGEVTLYNAQSTPQFSDSAEVEVLSTGNSWSYNPTKMDGAAMDGLLSGTPVCKEIEFEGNLAVSGNYVNVAIPGAVSAIGSVKYIDNSTVAAYDGRDVLVKGYFVGTSSGKYVNVLPYSVEETNPSTDPEMTVDPASLSFPAAGGEKSVTVTTRNADGCTIEASADNAKFSVSVSGTTVTVAAGENTSESAINATLTVKLMKSGSAVVTKTVALTQSGVSSGNDTKGTYTSMDIFTSTKDDSPSASYTLGNSTTFNGMEASGVKLGTSKKSGYFTSQAVGVAGSKKLSFYAVAWKGKSATLYVRVNGGGSVTSDGTALVANDGATGNPPFTITVSDSDYYTLDVTGLTASSTITFSTSPNFANESSSASRAVVAGIQLY